MLCRQANFYELVARLVYKVSSRRGPKAIQRNPGNPCLEKPKNKTKQRKKKKRRKLAKDQFFFLEKKVNLLP